jgi:cellulose synthase (UDP-forming)
MIPAFRGAQLNRRNGAGPPGHSAGAAVEQSSSSTGLLTAERPGVSPTAYTSTGQLLPSPPTDHEKHAWVRRELPLLSGLSLVSVICLTVSQVHFLRLSEALWALVPFIAFTLAYFVLSFWIGFGSRNFDLADHRALVEGWSPLTYPSVDILLPICKEDVEVLRNAWVHARRLIESYPGDGRVYVLDDGADPEAEAAALEMGFVYHTRANRGWFKKSGNLREGFKISTGEFLVIFDADFAARSDFLAETLPYMDDPSVAILQSPQYFRADPRQSWTERGGGAAQELFFRMVQVSRNRFGAAICVGSCAVYRREALRAAGGTALVEHSEDVHTGFDVTSGGWKLRYIPLPLATGLSPPDPDSFLTQQYRWCAGSMSLLASRKFWSNRVKLSARLCYISGYCYYIHTALFTFIAPIIPLVLLVFEPQQVRARNYLWILPSLVYNMVVFPLWHRGRYGPTALMAKVLYGWAHAFAIVDMVRSRRMEWQSTGARSGKSRTRRIWVAIGLWSSLATGAWLGVALYRMLTMSAVNFSFILATGLLYAAVPAMAFWSRYRTNIKVA